MADELTTSLTVAFSKTGCPPISRTLTERITISGNHAGETVQDIGTSAENIVLPGDIATNGRVAFINYGPTNYVDIGWDSTGFLDAFPLRVNEIAYLRLKSGRTYQARANTAGIRLGIIAVED